MSSREQFESWMTDEQWFHGSDFEWDERRNCYSQFGIHLAYKAWQAASKASEQQLAAVVAENAGLKDFVKTCFHAAADGASLDGADIQELGERLGLFGRETYQPALHGYICGHEAGEDTVYVMKKTPATDAFLAEVRAHGVDMFALMFAEEAIKSNNITTGWRAKASREASEYAEALREDAAQLRQGAAL